MDPETISTNTSLDDKTEDFCHNPTRDSLAEGLMNIVKPAIDQLDERIQSTRLSQLELKEKLEGLSQDLKGISVEKNCGALDLEEYSNKLMNTRHKITVIGNILQATQDRLNKLQTVINKETSRRKIRVSLDDPTVSQDLEWKEA